MGKIPNRGMGKWNVCETDWGIDNGDVEVAITASSIMVTDHTNGNVDRQVSIPVDERGVEALVGMLAPRTGWGEAQWDEGCNAGFIDALEGAGNVVEQWAERNKGMRITAARVQSLLTEISEIDS